MFHKRLLKEFKDNRKMIVGMVTAQWVMLLANIVLMLFMADFISNLFRGAEGINQSGQMYSLGAAFFLVVIIRGAMFLLNSRLSFKTSRQLKERLRALIYEKLMRLGRNYREKLKTSEAVQISTEGVEQLEIYFGKYMPQFFYSMLAPVTLFLVVGVMSLKVAVVLLLCVPLIPLSIVAVQRFAKKMLAKYWGTYTELGDSFLECLQGLTTLKIYQADERYEKKMDAESEKFRKVTMRVLIMQLNSISIMDLVAYGGAGIGIILSVLELQKGAVSLSQCFFMMMISAEFFLPLRLLGSFFHIAMNGNAAADKIFRLLDTEEEPVGSIKNMEEIKSSVVEFEQIFFSYQKGQQVLKKISFQAGKGMSALAGESGCGKSTITALLTGGLKPESGRIKIGTNLLSDMDQELLSRKITRIGHDSYLFAGTVKENLCMGKPEAKEEELLLALKQVKLYDFIMENGGLLMELTEKASNLSGGQKQRLALARALLHNTDIYIFDEVTSNVDVESENDIMEVIRKLAEEKTVIFISHRLANVIPAKQIYVVRDGQICEEGNHQMLYEKKGYYYTLFHKQQELEQYGREEALV